MSKQHPPFRASSYFATDVGVVRDHNEDFYLLENDLGLYGVADGMGGHAGGETASHMAVDTLKREVAMALAAPPPATEPPNAGPAEALKQQARDGLLRGFAHANAEIYAKSQTSPDLAGMGTTLTAMVLAADQAFFAHVGDSRAYLLREEQIIQLSDDHSLVNEHVKAGLITPEQARTSYFRNIITRSVGTEQTLVVDSFSVEAKAGDNYLLCSDGLVNMAADEELQEIIQKTAPEKVPQVLVELANSRGSDDNITIVFVQLADRRAKEAVHAPPKAGKGKKKRKQTGKGHRMNV